MKDKRSFFERLTGAVRLDDEKEEEIVEERRHEKKGEDWIAEAEEEGQLAVDVHQTSTEIIIKTMVAGVKPEDLDINITRDMVTIKGKREGERGVTDENYFSKELYWGSFSRSILLPQEVEPEEAEAVEKHGLLIIKLPKINKDRQTKLKVKTI
jgi:HSP20 family protein